MPPPLEQGQVGQGSVVRWDPHRTVEWGHQSKQVRRSSSASQYEISAEDSQTSQEIDSVGSIWWRKAQQTVLWENVCQNVHWGKKNKFAEALDCRLFTFFFRLAQAYVWTKTKGFYQSCTLRFLAEQVETVRIISGVRTRCRNSLWRMKVRDFC